MVYESQGTRKVGLRQRPLNDQAAGEKESLSRYKSGRPPKFINQQGTLTMPQAIITVAKDGYPLRYFSGGGLLEDPRHAFIVNLEHDEAVYNMLDHVSKYDKAPLTVTAVEVRAMTAVKTFHTIAVAGSQAKTISELLDELSNMVVLNDDGTSRVGYLEVGPLEFE